VTDTHVRTHRLTTPIGEQNEAATPRLERAIGALMALRATPALERADQIAAAPARTRAPVA
jgi:hypothetical protein